jgi:hypothetical protein
MLALLPGSAVFPVVVNRRNRLLQIASQSAANSQPVRRRTEEDDCVLRCTPMHSARSSSGTPIPSSPDETAQREAGWSHTTSLSQSSAPCSNAETPRRLKVAHCLCKHCLWLRVRSGQPLLQAAPGLHHDLPHPAASTAQTPPSTGQNMPQTCRRGTARASRVPHPSPLSQHSLVPPPDEEQRSGGQQIQHSADIPY